MMVDTMDIASLLLRNSLIFQRSTTKKLFWDSEYHLGMFWTCMSIKQNVRTYDAIVDLIEHLLALTREQEEMGEKLHTLATMTYLFETLTAHLSALSEAGDGTYRVLVNSNDHEVLQKEEDKFYNKIC